MSDTEAVQRAYHMGQEHGRNAADWLVDGNTPDIVRLLNKFVQGVEDGDPEILDLLPWPDLSGEWADGVTWYTLAVECDTDPDDVDLSTELCDAYEEGFSDGRDARIFEMATYYALDETP